MASISDIPEKLVNPTMSMQFVEWLLSMPVSQDTRIALGRIWQRFTGARLNTNEWMMIGNLPSA